MEGPRNTFGGWEGSGLREKGREGAVQSLTPRGSNVTSLQPASMVSGFSGKG